MKIISSKTCIYIFSIILLVVLLSRCTDNKIKQYFTQIESGKISVSGIKIAYPWEGTIFPPEFPAPHFEWTDTIAQSTEWQVFISDKKGQILVSTVSGQNSWQPDSVEWESIKEFSSNGAFTFAVIAHNSDNSYLSGKVSFSFSKDSVCAEIFFRAVTLPFSYAVKNVHTIEWYMGSVKGGRPRKMLDNLPVCGNCHSFSKGQPLLAMDVDYGNDKGSYVISKTKDTSYLKPDNIISWSYFKKEERSPTFGLLSQISPNGEYVLSTVKDLSVFAAIDNNLAYSQLFFPIKGIIGIYNMKTKLFSELEGANDPKYVQSNPSWSPNMDKVIFARTEAYVSDRVNSAGRALLHVDDIKEFTSGEKQFKYDLFSVDFNNAKGGKAQPLAGASFNGKSNYFAKYSPDGKWVVFCQASNFMLLQPDSKLFIMPASGGEAREMNCNMSNMNSWHSWSPNGKWLVFSSKNRGLYTQLYLTHIDENGLDSPPILLENLRFEKRAANIPEFYPGNANSFKAIKDAFSNTSEYYLQIATDNTENKYYKKAWDNISKSIALDSNLLEAYFQRITLNGILKQTNSVSDRYDKLKAKMIVDSLLLKIPEDDKLLLLNATLYSIIGNTNEALEQAFKVLKTNPKSYKPYELICSIYRKTKQYDKLLPMYLKMKALFPNYRPQIENLIESDYEETEQFKLALASINKQIKDNPYDLNLLASRAALYLKTKKYETAKKDIDFILEKNTSNYKYNQLLNSYYLSLDKQLEADTELTIILKLIDKQIAANNEDFELLFEKANILSRVKRWREADEIYTKILGIFPNNYEALKERARIKLTNQQWNDAISLYNQLEKNYMAEEEFFNNMAIAYINIGNYEQALSNFDKTIELNPQNFDARYNRCKLLKMMANNNLADEELKKLKSDMQQKKLKGKLSDNEADLLKILQK